MKLNHYYIINKNTGKAVAVDCWKHKAEAKLAGMADKENYFIGTKLVAI